MNRAGHLWVKPGHDAVMAMLTAVIIRESG